MSRRAALSLLLLPALLTGSVVRAATPEDLVRAYPDVLAGFDGTDLIWRDGTRMPVGHVQPATGDNGVPAIPSIADQLASPYPVGMPLGPPQGDPGRARNAAMFQKMYGDCQAGTVAPRLVRIVWLPRTWGHTISITSVNGADLALQAVSRELDDLPVPDKAALFPIGGTYNCRRVAGSDQTSMHAWGAAIDINVAYSDYWRWRGGRDGVASYRNRIPADVVTIFERHGFIWGGRWTHFDTMHFEYRPELTGDPPAPAR